MVERYAIDFGPAVSQKELKKALHEVAIHGDVAISERLHEMKARIEVVGGFEDLKTLRHVLRTT